MEIMMEIVERTDCAETRVQQWKDTKEGGKHACAIVETVRE